MTNSAKIFQDGFDKAASTVQLTNNMIKDINMYKGDMKEEGQSLEGGLADKMSLGDIATKHGVDIEDLTQQFLKGMKKETEHTKNKIEAANIAMDHLVEDPKYYDELKKIEGKESMEKSAKQQFAIDVQDDPDFIKFKRDAKYKDRDKEFTFGTPNVTLDDPYIKKRKYSRVGKEESKERTSSGSSGAFSGPIAFKDSEFLRNSFKETPKLKEETEKVEANEATGSGSVGAYETPAAWAKSTKKKDWRGKSKTQIPGGAFVSVKEKCKKFPYCNQGDIKALHIYKNESVKEAIENVSKKLNLSQTTIKAILEYEMEKLKKQPK